MRTLGSCTSPEVPEAAELLVIPVGATEQHGPHLPLSTDTDIAVGVARRLGRAIDGVVIAPPLPYGSSGEHQSFAGTLSIGQTATELVLVELARSANETFPRILLVSTHGGNRELVGRAVGRLRAERRDVRAWSPRESWPGDTHAGRAETSIMLALHPGLVRMERATAGPDRPLEEMIAELRGGGVAAVSRSGVLGDPSGATAAIGERLLREAERELATAIKNWVSCDRGWL
jgi:creatinine amidohydrolase